MIWLLDKFFDHQAYWASHDCVKKESWVIVGAC